ncbi:hypothetical protein [Sphingopyxis sp. NJF-3]
MPRLHRGLIEPILDRRHDAGDRLVDPRQSSPIGVGLNKLLAILAIDVRGISRDSGFDLVSRHRDIDW